SSGGMRRLIMLASVLMPRPALLIADEPTTALDSVVQRQVLEIMAEVTRDLGTAVLLITHDLGLVAEYAQEVLVLNKGSVVEAGTVAQILTTPRDSYTRALLEAVPRRAAGGKAVPPTPDTGRPLVDVRDLRVWFPGRRAWPWQPRPVTRAVE